MTSGHHPVSADRSTPGPPPAEIEDAARQRELGALQSSRTLAHPLTSAAIGLGIAVAAFAVMSTLVSVQTDPFGFLHSILHALVFACFLTGVYGLVHAVRQLVVGARSYWVFENGFVHRQRTTIRALGWAEVQRLSPVIGTKGDTAGKVLHYTLVPQTGRPITVPLAVKDGRDPFMDALMAALQRHGKPVN